MKVQARLTLSYILMVLFFLVCFAGSWWNLGGSDLLILMHKPLEGLGERMVERTELALAEGGWPLAEQGLRWAFLSRQAAMVLYRDGRSTLIQGERSPNFDPDKCQLARQGKRIDYVRPDQGVDLYLPIRIPRAAHEKQDYAVIMVRLPGRGLEAQRGLLTLSLIRAGLFSGLATVAFGLAASSLIAIPVRRLTQATTELADTDFHEPIQVGDLGELSELARTFNRMSSRLNENVSGLREAKERAERSEALRREFMAEVSHNLRTPLAAIQGWTEALLDGLVPGKEAHHLRKIHRETLFVAQTVQRLLDWSRWEDSPPQLKLTQFPISEPLLDSAISLSESAEAKEIELSFDGLQNEPIIEGDRHRTREIFQLLLENAVHHNPLGTQIRVSFEKVADRIQVQVRDNGKGLPEEFRSDLRCRVGGGLGLAIASRLVEAHGGRLTVEPGPGTVLQFSFACSNTQSPSSPPANKAVVTAL